MIERTKPRVWPVFVATFAILAFQLAGSIPISIAAVGAGSFDIKDALGTAPALAAFVCVSALSLVLAIAALATHPWRVRLSLPSFRASPIDVALAVVGAFGVGALTMTVAQLIGSYDDSALARFRTIFTSASGPAIVVVCIAVVVTGALEEVFYRGYVQTRLSHRFGALAGIVVASTLFGAAHLDVVQGIFAFFLGAFIGFIALRTRSIATGLYAHAINNALAVLMPFAFAEEKPEEPQVLTAILGGVAFAVSAAAIWWRTRLVVRPVLSVAASPADASLPVASPSDTASSDAASSDAASSNIAPVVFVAPSRTRRFVLVALSAALLLGFATLGAIAVVAVTSARTTPVSPDTVRIVGERGRAFGLDHEDRACVDEAVRLPSGEGAVFVSWCLPSARRTDLCDGAPAPTSVLAFGNWIQDHCKTLRQDDVATCTPVMAAVARHCAGRWRA